MELETKQLYFFIILTVLSLKINASPETENETDVPLTSDGDSVNNTPNIEFTTRGVDVAKKNPFADDSHRPFPIFVYEDTTSCNNLLPFVDSKRILECSTSFEEESWGSFKEYSESSSTSSIKSFSMGFTAPDVTLAISDPSGIASMEVTPVPNSVNVGDGKTDSTSDMAYFFNQEGGSVSRSRISCDIYDVTVNINNPHLKLHSGFIADIKKIDLAVTDAQKKAVMLSFIENYGTHYAKKSEMGVGMEFETRYNQEETTENTRELRNKCSSESGGFSYLGIGASKESSECSAFAAASKDGASSHVRRMEHITYGVLPDEGEKFGDVGAWGNRVQEMWVAGTLSPIPIKQELEPIYKIFLTDIVRNIVHDDGKTKININNVVSTAVKYYSEYCTLMENCDFPACPKSVKLGEDIYHETVHAVQGRKIYEDPIKGNSLMYREENYTNGWVVVKTLEPEKILMQTAPCPQVGGKFIPSSDESKLPKPLPSKSWKECSIMCQNDFKCNFWQFNEFDSFKSCLLFEDYESIETSDATKAYIIGSKDCPGDDKVSQSSYGQCPHNIKAKSMWKIGGEKGFNKDLRIKTPVCPAGSKYDNFGLNVGRCYETACPTDEENQRYYRLVEGRCYFFYTRHSSIAPGIDYVDRNVCENISKIRYKASFPNGGRLFEPKSIEIFEKVMTAIDNGSTFSKGSSRRAFIGVTRDPIEGSDFKFHSNGVTVPYDIPWASNSPSTSYSNQQCVYAPFGTLEWHDDSCTASNARFWMPICESKGLTPSWA